MAYLALYRLYRPTDFASVVGQDHITRTLKNQVDMGRIGHAYLFSGARGTGKTSTAKVLAKAVNCQSPVMGEPCGQCDICRMSAEDLSVDILEIDAASNNGVDEIRDLREKISFAPAVCRYKVYIIDEVHMLSTGAFNALLKTLEEPPAHAVFILATTEMHKLPATILSRCQRFDFKRIPESIILEQLKQVAEKQGVDCEEAALDAVAHAAGGGMRDALSILDQCFGYAGDSLRYEDVVKILGGAGAENASAMGNAIMSADVISCMNIVQNVYDGGADMAVFARELIEYFRTLMMETAAQGKAGMPLRAVQELSRAESTMRYSPQPRVTLEAALVKLCTATQEQDVSALLERIERLEATVDSLRKAPHVQVAATATPQENATQADECDYGTQTEDSPPWGNAQPEAADDIQTEEVAQAEPENITEAGTAGEPDTQQQETAAIPVGDIDPQQLFNDMMAILKKEQPRIHPMLIFGKPLSVEDGVFTLRFKPEDKIMADAMQNKAFSSSVDEILERVSGQSLKLHAMVARQGADPPKAEKADKKAAAKAAGEKQQENELNAGQQDMLQKVKDAFGMDIEITD